MRLLVFIFFLILSSCSSAEEIEYGIYLVNGEAIYQQNCANCHGLKGEGLRDLYPALKSNKSLSHLERLVCDIKNGINSEAYPQAMPANSKLFDLDIAQLVTYINKEFSNEAAMVKAEEVKAILADCE